MGFSIQIILTDHRHCELNNLSTNKLELLSNDEVCIQNVPTSVNCLRVCGWKLEELGPGLCFIKYGNQECETYAIPHKIKKISIYSTRKTFLCDTIEIRIKIWFPRVCTYEHREKEYVIKFKDLVGARELPDHYVHVGTDEVDN